MKLTLKRSSCGEDGIFGRLFNEDMRTLFLTLERAFPTDDGDNGHYEPKIPAGIYTCIRYKSPHFGYDVFMLTDVPGHDHIEIHIANWERQLNGCIALGEEIHGDMLTRSKEAFDAFMALMEGQNEFELEIK